MPDFSYSTEALNCLKKFTKSNLTVFVEDDPDIAFWKDLFDIINVLQVDFKPVGGKNNLNPYIKKIINEDAKIHIAMDNDHSPFTNEINSHKRIIKTYGYSIENTQYCPIIIDNIINKCITNPPRNLIKDIKNWYEIEIKKLIPLLIFDITNSIEKKGIKCLPDSCDSLIAKNIKKPSFSKNKIKEQIQKFQKKFQKNELNKSRTLVLKDKREYRFLIKGHFLTRFVQKYIIYIINQEKPKDGFSQRELTRMTKGVCKHCDLFSKCKDINITISKILESLT